MKISSFLISLFFFIGSCCCAQNNIVVKQDPAIQKLIDRHIELNATVKRVSGWRIQLMSNSDRDEVNRAKAQFLTAHPNAKTYLTYQQPYFKLRVGDFADKNEAYKYMKDINDDFKGIFIVPDIVNVFPEGTEEKN